MGGLRLVLCVAFLVGGGASRLWAAPTRQDLVAHGSGERFWLARVSAAPADGSRPGTPKSLVYARSVGESRWNLITQAEFRIVGMAHRGSQIALLLDDGDWLLASEDALVTGRPLPGGTIIDLASGGDSLLALARLGAPAAGAIPTSSPAATTPTTTPAAELPSRLALFTLGPGGWVESGDLGVTTAATRADVSLAVVDSTVTVAQRDPAEPRLVRLRRQATDGRWAEAGSVDVGAEAAAFKLLGGGPVPVLWVLARDGGYSLHWFGAGGVRSQVVPTAPGVRAGEVGAALAMERVRVVSAGQGGELSERTYDPMPAPTSQPSPGDAPVLLPKVMNPWMTLWVRPLLTLALLFTVVASLRRRQAMQQALAGAHKLPLAPPGRRFLAGLIDAAPLLAAAAVFAARGQQLADPVALAEDRLVQVAVGVGVALYFLHTTAVEVLAGRTVGKMLVGLRVVGLDGERPGAGALLTRNLLRVIDVLIFFFPLVLVLYSPLRQRAGDVAAGTLVVTAKRESETGVDESAAAEKSEPTKADAAR